jgi:hypothetical protein
VTGARHLLDHAPERTDDVQSHAENYIQSADKILIEDLDYYHDPDAEKARLQLAEAQVRATQAVAAAVDRLAEALENLSIN